MSQNTVAVISCDHENCGQQNQVQNEIVAVQPFYHLKIEISTIDAKGTVCLVSIDKDVCRWDCWSEISNAHDFAVADLEHRKEQAAVESNLRLNPISNLSEQLDRAEKASQNAMSWLTVPNAAEIPEGSED